MLLPVVPLPAHVTMLTGTYTPKTFSISASSADAQNVAGFAAQFLRSRAAVSIVPAGTNGVTVRFEEPAGDAKLGKEGYRLRIDGSGIVIRANSGSGLFYGLQTLEQLFPQKRTANTLQEVDITDAPAYRWRGIMLDVSRHFFTVETVKRYIDLAAHYKLNTFHWHLTDDQGWRVEIKRYPRLTQIGSCRAGTQIGHNAARVDSIRYCGYYTQAQIRDVVAYAAKRYVTIVPEVEMPGHSTAAIAAYPFLACNGARPGVSETWGGSYPICPTEKAIAFEEGVLTEIMQLFPGPYIHTGGDEVPFSQWRRSTFVHGLMQQQNLQTYPQVQAYFERRIERFIERHGRRMVGWDEILEGGISPSAVIMSWRGVRGGIAAAQHGNDAVMSPDGPLYFNAYQGDRNDEPDAIGEFYPLQQVYDYNPMPSGLTPQQRSHILGVQANIWAEYISTVPQLFYQALPRELALSEIAWVPAANKDWDSFIARSGPQYAWLEANGYNFRIPNPTLSVDAPSLTFTNVSTSVRTVSAETRAAQITLRMSQPIPGAVIRYTTDGSEPNAASPVYRAALRVPLARGQRVDIIAVTVLRNGRISTPSEIIIRRAR